MSLFSQFDLNDSVAGGILLVVSIAILCSCLVLMVKLLHSMLKGQIAKVIHKTLNADFPGCLSHLTGYVAILIGAGMTILVQSSSVFTSALTPLVGLGVIRLERVFPMTLGSNVGTTATGLLAAMAAPSDKLSTALQIALCHLFFNISGILLFYPIPILRRIPIRLAKFLGNTTAKYRWFPIAYLILMFIVTPGVAFALSFAGFIPFVSVGSAMVLLALSRLTVNILQSRRPKVLPRVLRTWEFLPLCLRSLEPADNVIMGVVFSVTRRCPCCDACCRRGARSKRPRTYRTPDLTPSSTCTRLDVSPCSSRAASVLLLNSASNINCKKQSTV